MTGRARRRLSHTLTGLAAITFPKARRSDAHVVRDCAREAVDATSMRALPRESLSLAMAGMRTRIGLAATEFRHAPWRDALARVGPPAGSHAPAGLDLRLHLALRPLAARRGLGAAAGRLAPGGDRGGARAALAHGRGRDRRLRGGGVALRRLRDRCGDLADTPSFFHGLERRHRRGIATPHSAAGGRRAQPAAQSGATGQRRPRAAGGGACPGTRRGGVPVPRPGARADRHDVVFLTGRAAEELASGRPIRCPGSPNRDRCCGSSASRWPWRSS